MTMRADVLIELDAAERDVEHWAAHLRDANERLCRAEAEFSRATKRRETAQHAIEDSLAYGENGDKK